MVSLVLSRREPIGEHIETSDKSYDDRGKSTFDLQIINIHGGITWERK